jgi:hypothetical protein
MNNKLFVFGDKSLEDLVAELWLEAPGIGTRALMERLAQHQQQEQQQQQQQQQHNIEQQGHGGTVAVVSFKKRVKAAKDAITYRRILSTDDSPLERMVTTVTTTTAARQGEGDNKQEGEFFYNELFVQQQLQLRQSYRTAASNNMKRQLDKADRIASGLNAMGIEIDDRFKTWKLVERRALLSSLSPSSSSPPSNLDVNVVVVGVPCQKCNRLFGSRNLIFQHLRDPASGCGTDIFAAGETVAVPPSWVKKQRNQEARKRSTKGGTTTTTTVQQQYHHHHQQQQQQQQPANADCCLWLGGLPLPWTKAAGRYRRLRSILYSLLTPLLVPQPWIKIVNRKAYRDGTTGNPIGYTIAVFRDADEATMVLQNIHGIRISFETVYPTSNRSSSSSSLSERKFKHDVSDLIDVPEFALEVRNVFHPAGDTTTVTPFSLAEAVAVAPNHKPPPIAAGLDPPLVQQFKPLSRKELWRRAGVTHQENGSEDESTKQCLTPPLTKSYEEHEAALTLAVARYQQHGDPRRIVYHQGRLVPRAIRDHLLQLLEQLRWPAKRHRKGMCTERYLVLHTNAANKTKQKIDLFYQDVRDACRALMEWADPHHYYSAIAVTKNFVGSPHIDDRDQTYQYALSLGNFGDGGQLCVDDGGSKDCLHVVNTHNRIAKVDGRHVHWVRTWQGGSGGGGAAGGDRYSLIFYDTSNRNPTPLLEDCVVDWDDNSDDDKVDHDEHTGGM